VKSRRPSRRGHETNAGKETLKSFGQETCRNKTTGQTLWRQKYSTEVCFTEIGREVVETMNFAQKKCVTGCFE
jgi:hypothetical protein